MSIEDTIACAIDVGRGVVIFFLADKLDCDFEHLLVSIRDDCRSICCIDGWEVGYEDFQLHARVERVRVEKCIRLLLIEGKGCVFGARAK